MATVEDVTRCVEANRDGWTNFGRSLGLSLPDAEDSLQNAWLRAARAVERYHYIDGVPFRRWVWRIFVNECVRTSTRVSRDRDFVARLRSHAQTAQYEGMPIEDIASIWDIVEHVREPEREWLVLCYVVGMSQKEIALQFGVGPRTVQRRLRTMRHRIRETAGYLE
jgi:RNA polymerase sigma factor (sigma-70 family)